MKNSHHSLVNTQFGVQAEKYLHSAVHAQGEDLQRLAEWLSPYPSAHVLDVGCGGGHASFTAASQVAQVTACDLSENMLAVVERAAQANGIPNLSTRQGSAEALPFDTHSIDIVISRYSAHHWHDVPLAMREIKRVLKPGGTFILMDIASPGRPVLDIWLQTAEMLRDPSHVRNYSQGEWLKMANESGMTVKSLEAGRLELDFAAWIERMQTPSPLVAAIRLLQQKVSGDVADYYAIAADGSFTTDTIMFRAQV